LTDLRNVMTVSVLMVSASLAVVGDVNPRMEARYVRTTKMFNAWDMVDVRMKASAVEAKSFLTNPVPHPVLQALRTGVVISPETASLLLFRIPDFRLKLVSVLFFCG